MTTELTTTESDPTVVGSETAPAETTQVADPAPAGPGPSVEDILRYDPFAKVADVAPDPAATQPQPVAKPAATTTAKPAASAKPAQPAAKPAAPVKSAAELENERLKGELDRQGKMLEQAMAAAAKPASAPAPSPAPADDGVAALYNFAVPPQVMEQLSSDDPLTRANALTAVQRATAVTVHRQVMGQVGRVMKQLVEQHLPSMIQGVHSEAVSADAIRKDFYGKYPQFDNAALRPMVIEVAKVVMTEGNYQGWSEAVRDAVAQRLIQTLTGALPPATVADPAPAPRRQPLMTGNSAARLPSASPNPNSPQAIGDTLFGG